MPIERVPADTAPVETARTEAAAPQTTFEHLPRRTATATTDQLPHQTVPSDGA